LGYFIVIILITIFELFAVSLTLFSEKNFLKILRNVFVPLKKGLLRLTLLKIGIFALILVPGIILLVLGSVFSQTIGILVLLLLPLAVMPIYAFCCNILVKGIFDIHA
jgi:hypothetical protein